MTHFAAMAQLMEPHQQIAQAQRCGLEHLGAKPDHLSAMHQGLDYQTLRCYYPYLGLGCGCFGSPGAIGPAGRPFGPPAAWGVLATT